VLRRSQGIREQFPGDPWIHFCNGSLKFTYFLNLRNNICLNNRGTSLIGNVFFAFQLEYLITKPPIPKTRATVSLIKVKLCNSLLRMMLVWIRCYLTSVLRYNLLSLDNYYPDTIFT